MHAQGLDLETDTSNNIIYGSPSEVSLEPGYEATSEVYVIDELTFFKGLSGDKASSITVPSRKRAHGRCNLHWAKIGGIFEL